MSKWSIRLNVSCYGKMNKCYFPAWQCKDKTPPLFRLEFLSYPPYLPDFHLLWSLKYFNESEYLKNKEEIENSFSNFVGKNADFIKHGIKNFSSCFTAISENEGEYIFYIYCLNKFNSHLFVYLFWWNVITFTLINSVKEAKNVLNSF